MATQTNCGGLMYDANTLEVNANKELAVKDGVVALPTATTSVLGGVKQATNQADSTATDVAGLLADFNALLLKLKTAGIMVADV
jgi:hypothetical protein